MDRCQHGLVLLQVVVHVAKECQVDRIGGKSGRVLRSADRHHLCLSVGLRPPSDMIEKILGDVDRVDLAAMSYLVGDQTREQTGSRADIRNRHSLPQPERTDDLAAFDIDFTVVGLKSTDEALDIALLELGIDSRIDTLLGLRTRCPGARLSLSPAGGHNQQERPPGQQAKQGIEWSR